MTHTAYHLSEPKFRSSGVVFASPHSGSTYPRPFLERSVLDEHVIRSSEDAYVDQLFDVAPDFGAPFLQAAMPRAYVDLNRGPDELDPALIEGARCGGQNPRISSGLGVIPRVVANGRSIYRGKLTLDEAQARLEGYWHPYHQRLRALLDESQRDFGQAILIDCHSMPHEALEGICRRALRRPEIVIGDRFGASASSEIVDRVERAFSRVGLVVARNTPFAGAYVAQTYGRPSRGQHAIQIEIDRSLYMDEACIRPHGGFDTFRRMMRSVIADLVEIGRDQQPLAAE